MYYKPFLVFLNFSKQFQVFLHFSLFHQLFLIILISECPNLVRMCDNNIAWFHITNVEYVFLTKQTYCISICGGKTFASRWLIRRIMKVLLSFLFLLWSDHELQSLGPFYLWQCSYNISLSFGVVVSKSLQSITVRKHIFSRETEQISFL